MPTSFTFVKKGYNPIEVDNYIETLENVIKSYKEKDSAIKNAIINAQIAADRIIKDAEKKSEDMSNTAITKMDIIKKSVEQQRKFVQAFQEDYNSLVEKYVHDFNQKDILPIYSRISELEEYLDDLTNGRTPTYEPEAAATPIQKSPKKDSEPLNNTDSTVLDNNADIAELLKL